MRSQTVVDYCYPTVLHRALGGFIEIIYKKYIIQKEYSKKVGKIACVDTVQGILEDSHLRGEN